MIKSALAFCTVLLTLQLQAQLKREAYFPYRSTDSVITPISMRYEPASFLHRIIMGKNYRKTWSTEVRLPVFYLSRSPFKIKELGGGEQTKSLELLDASGNEWRLRTVDKTVEKAIPQYLRNTPAENVVQDMISASYPYSHIIVGELSRSAGIISGLPLMFYVADDPALGPYRSLFAHTICTLEDREPIAGNPESKDTKEVQEKIAGEGNHRILQKQYLKARLMDMLVGDWDRHEDQWSWIPIDSASTTFYYAIPKDRDNALFHSGGFLPLLARWTFMPHISGFKKNSNNIRRLSKKSWPLDRAFLHELDRPGWEQLIREFQHTMTDSVITASVNAIPPQAYPIDGAKIIDKLKSRRDGLLKHALAYYRFLSKTVTINGSDQGEFFVASGAAEGLRITVYQLNKEQQRLKIYERVFDPSETAYIRLNGLKGNDHFVLEESAKSKKIRIRINGNEGKDVFEMKGLARIKILDRQQEDVVMNDTTGRAGNRP